MKQIILGDIHGYPTWKRIVDKHPEADRIIFIGDYLDSFDISGIEQLHNLNALIRFKNESKKEVIFLIGNHDHQYWPGVGYSGTSGYQPKMHTSFEAVFHENRSLFQMCFEDEKGVIYSHAGFSAKWCREVLNLSGSTDMKGLVNAVNELFIVDPKKFCYDFRDPSGYGEHPMQSCIWIRPETLYGCQINNLQVVGHTHVGQINHPPKSERRGFYLIDCLPKQYLSCTDGVFKIENVNDGPKQGSESD